MGTFSITLFFSRYFYNDFCLFYHVQNGLTFQFWYYIVGFVGPLAASYMATQLFVIAYFEIVNEIFRHVLMQSNYIKIIAFSFECTSFDCIYTEFSCFVDFLRNSSETYNVFLSIVNIPLNMVVLHQFFFLSFFTLRSMKIWCFNF